MAAFISSYIPLFVLIIINNWQHLLVNLTSKISLGVLLLLMAYGISTLLIYFFGKSTAMMVSANEKINKSPNDSLINYLMAYIVPLSTFNICSFFPSVLVNVILFIVIGILYIRLNLVALNPILTLFGYVAYSEDNTGKMYLTNMSPQFLEEFINDSSVAKGRQIKGLLITDNIIIVRQRDN